MTITFDIFRMETTGVLWLESAATLESAKTRVHELAANSPGNYLVVDQSSGVRHVMEISRSDLPVIPYKSGRDAR